MKTRINLETKVRLTGKFEGESSFPFWKNAKAGDVIRVSLPFAVIFSGGGGGGVYSPYLTLTNDSGEIFQCDFNRALYYLLKCGFKPYTKVEQHKVVNSPTPYGFRLHYVTEHLIECPECHEKKPATLFIEVHENENPPRVVSHLHQESCSCYPF